MRLRLTDMGKKGFRPEAVVPACCCSVSVSLLGSIGLRCGSVASGHCRAQPRNLTLRGACQGPEAQNALGKCERRPTVWTNDGTARKPAGETCKMQAAWLVPWTPWVPECCSPVFCLACAWDLRSLATWALSSIPCAVAHQFRAGNVILSQGAAVSGPRVPLPRATGGSLLQSSWHRVCARGRGGKGGFNFFSSYKKGTLATVTCPSPRTGPWAAPWASTCP